MGSAFKARRIVFAVVAVLGWVAVATTATITFEREVTVPHCHEVCRAAGDELDHYRGYTKSNPREACVCRSGRALYPGLLRNPVMFMLTAFVGLPMFLLFRWSKAVDARAARERAERPPIPLKQRRR